jgi:hypothetical protein
MDYLRSRAFDTLDISEHILDMHGWMDPQFENVFTKNVENLNRESPLTIIEVGTWKGLSCTTMAKIVKELGFKNVKIFCIDTWLGAPEFHTWGLDDPVRGISLKCVNGYPTIYDTFIKNVKYLGHDDIVYPFPLSSQQAADVLNYYGIKADIIYIDASHEYEALKSDLLSYQPLLKDEGTIIGDDYQNNWPGVTRAVNEFIKNPIIQGVVWYSKKVM